MTSRRGIAKRAGEGKPFSFRPEVPIRTALVSLWNRYEVVNALQGDPRNRGAQPDSPANVRVRLVNETLKGGEGNASSVLLSM